MIKDGKNGFRGIEAVIDKDLAGELLAEIVEAGVFMILTDVPNVYLDYGTPQQRKLNSVSVAELRTYEAEGHFAAGSMGPKVRAAIRFAAVDDRRAVITSLENALPALKGEAGTQITARGQVVLPMH